MRPGKKRPSQKGQKPERQWDKLGMRTGSEKVRHCSTAMLRVD